MQLCICCPRIWLIWTLVMISTTFCSCVRIITYIDSHGKNSAATSRTRQPRSTWTSKEHETTAQKNLEINKGSPAQRLLRGGISRVEKSESQRQVCNSHMQPSSRILKEIEYDLWKKSHTFHIIYPYIHPIFHLLQDNCKPKHLPISC